MSTSISLLNNDFSAQSTSNKIAIYWNNKSLVDGSAPGSAPIAGADVPYGPVPLVDISRSYNMENGNLSSITTNIDLTGKILSLKNGIVFDDVMKKAKKLEDLFKSCVFGSFGIMCGGAIAYSGDNFYVKGIQFNKTDNNWTRFLDYTVNLESKSPVTGLKTRSSPPTTWNDYANYVESRSDVWTIEQLQDYTFSKFRDTINREILALENNGADGKGKNTYVLPEPGGDAVGGGSVGQGISIDLVSVPQFKISRKLSAKGLPHSGLWPVACNTSGLDTINHIKFLNAKAWVNRESDKLMDHTPSNHSGSIRLAERTNDNVPFNVTGTWFYNHLRTTNADIYNGTYEINDTWLAMPSGIGYTETFTLDSSTNANGIKSVRVAGTVQGLYIHNIEKQTDDTHHIISGRMPDFGVNIPTLLLNLSGSINDTVRMSASHQMPSYLNMQSKVTHIEQNKYRNALSGWLQEVKPYLYRRACIGHQRSVTPVFQVNRFKPLRTIPVSTNEGHDPLKGIITYNYEYNNQFRAISGVLSENINIVDDAPTNNIIETPVMGRELGPIIQSLGANNPRRTVTIDLVVQAPTGINSMLRSHVSCPLYVSGSIYGAVQAIINGNKPFDARTGPIWTNYLRNSAIEGNVFTQSDDESWEPTQGRYSRTITWIYKQCDPTKDFMDN